MKKHLLTLLSSLALTAVSLAHGAAEIGPNGGRILEFSKDESMHGEVTMKGGKFQIAVLDKAMKPVALAEQSLTATASAGTKADRLKVEKDGDHFVVPAVKSGEWLIVQFKETAKAKAITARFQYDTKICGSCKGEEWLCKCAAEKVSKPTK
jgi:hypothetical protein